MILHGFNRLLKRGSNCHNRSEQYRGDKTHPMHSIAWWPILAVTMIATITDLRSQRIPNWLVFPFLLAGMVVSTVVGGWSGLEHSVLGVLLAAALMGLFYVLGGMGMGDVKLCAGIGAWVGPEQLAFALAFMGLAGGVMAFGWALRRGFLKESLTGAGDLIFGLKKRGLRRHATLVIANPAAHRMPYAPAIAVGAILSFFAQG
jgi:prepilin peptidase CpaA